MVLIKVVGIFLSSFSINAIPFELWMEVISILNNITAEIINIEIVSIRSSNEIIMYPLSLRACHRPT